MNIPEALVEDARQGRIVLLLGAGASRGAKNAEGLEAPTSVQLRDFLADRFLGGKYKDHPLAFVAELSISETSLPAVQDFIASLLRDLKPAPFHLLIPTFRWRAIVTTNYDLVIQTAYSIPDRLQELVPILSNKDRMDEKLRNLNSLALLKLHGCITRTNDPELPLILTTDQYITHRKGRHLLFQTFEGWASEYPVVFIGSEGQDPDIRAILLEVSREPEQRPRYYLIKPSVAKPEARLWETKRITTLAGTLDDFLRALGDCLPIAMRPLLAVVKAEHPIRRHFVVNEEVGGVLKTFLENDVEYVHGSISIPDGKAQAFYKGFDFGWYPVLTGLDVRRRLTDTLLNDVVIRAEEDRPTPTELYLVKAEAGAGKSVFLRRLAWEAAKDADALCLYARPYGALRFEPVKELHRVTQQRIFLFVDNAADRAQAIAQLMAEARRTRLPLTIFTAERVNVWNMSCERLVEFLTEAHTLRYLNHQEVEALVTLLQKADALGPYLTGKSTEECVRQFEEQAGRQILVALHEATMGYRFEDILAHEFSQIQPRIAQQLYLTVCVMNRLNVPVRAGLIARVHGIAFAAFKEHFFSPLEHVVHAALNEGTQDYYYVARHPEIAQIVFEQILQTPEDRSNEYIRIIRQLNLAYTSDRAAYRGLLRARTLHELFPNYEDVKAIFEAATEAGSEEAYLLQQRANYERIRPDGNIVLAEQLLQKARELEPRDLTLIHTLAELKFARAIRAAHPLEREKYRNECSGLLRPLLADPEHGTYALHTLVKVALQELQDTLTAAESTDRQIDGAIRGVEDLLQKGIQQFSADPLLLSEEAELSRLLKDHERAFHALRKAFDANPRDPYIASRLSRTYEERGDLETARDVLRQALDGNRGNRDLNFRYGMLLRNRQESNRANLIYHFGRAFTKWDKNYEAQFWFARFAFEDENREVRREGKEVFRRLREAHLSHDVRVHVRDTIRDATGDRVFTGNVARLEYACGYVELDGYGDWLFVHRNDVPSGVWENLRVGVRVKCVVGFSFNGARALKVERL
jgi:tetratricopeptide (TPR) repeat protein